MCNHIATHLLRFDPSRVQKVLFCVQSRGGCIRCPNCKPQSISEMHVAIDFRIVCRARRIRKRPMQAEGSRSRLLSEVTWGCLHWVERPGWRSAFSAVQVARRGSCPLDGAFRRMNARGGCVRPRGHSRLFQGGRGAVPRLAARKGGWRAYKRSTPLFEAGMRRASACWGRRASSARSSVPPGYRCSGSLWGPPRHLNHERTPRCWGRRRRSAGLTPSSRRLRWPPI